MLNQYKIINAEKLHYLPASEQHPANTYFHFSFADYYNPNNIDFGVLRVLNDDDVKPLDGFDKHPHSNMEIVSYVVKGELTHWDSATKLTDTLGRGHVQIVSAGNGVWHSELNNQQNDYTRFLQIWIKPPRNGLPVQYDNCKFTTEQRTNKLLQIVGNSSSQEQIPLCLNQDVNLFVSEIDDKTAKVKYSLGSGRQAYVNNIEGCVNIKELACLDERDSLEIIGPAELEFSLVGETAHFIVIEMPEVRSIQ